MGKVETAFRVAFKVVFIVVMIFFFGFIVWAMIQPEEECFVDEKIFSITLTKQMEGSFILGSGSFEDKPYYYFYKEAQDGLQGKILSKVPAEETSIQETDSISPVYRKFGTRVKDCSNCRCGTSYKGTLFVPSDTVKLKFNVNPEEL